MPAPIDRLYETRIDCGFHAWSGKLIGFMKQAQAGRAIQEMRLAGRAERCAEVCLG